MQVYLSRALGLLDVPHATVPVLAKALDGMVDVEVRKGAVASLALIAGRALERDQPLGSDAVDALVGLSLDSDPALRRAAAFALGLMPSPDSDARLNVMLGDTDHMTAVNAAIALARQHSKSGLSIFAKALAATPPADNAAAIQDALLIQKNVLKAVAELGPSLDGQERLQMRQLIQPLADDHSEPRIRIDAQRALAALTHGGR
jgi:HEAT repeat protein